MKKYNLTQRQYKWLLGVCYGSKEYEKVPFEFRSKAYYILRECGYNREYDEEFRSQLLWLREGYIKWYKTIDMLDDLPF